MEKDPTVLLFIDLFMNVMKVHKLVIKSQNHPSPLLSDLFFDIHIHECTKLFCIFLILPVYLGYYF